MAALAGCTSSDGSSADATTGPGPSAETASAAAADEAALIARYEAALISVPENEADVRTVLSLIRDQHRAHLDALGGAPEQATPTAGSATTASLVADLISAERAASEERITACVDARDPEMARLLSFIAASEAAHVPALRDLRSAGGAS